MFGAIVVGLRVIPRGADMALLSTYPARHLAVDAVNGILTSFAIALTLVLYMGPVAQP